MKFFSSDRILVQLEYHSHIVVLFFPSHYTFCRLNYLLVQVRVDVPFSDSVLLIHSVISFLSSSDTAQIVLTENFSDVCVQVWTTSLLFPLPRL